jgi:uncharacterized membrane protein (TIGR02234 family)
MKLSAVTGLVVLGAAVTAAAALVTWADGTFDDDLRGAITATAKGSAAAPALLPIALAALAAFGAILASRGVLRRIIGGLIALLGVAAGWLGVRGFRHEPLDVLLPANSAAGAGQVAIHPIGPMLAVVGGLCLLAAGLPVVAGRVAARSLSARYERGSTSANTAATDPDPNLTMWRELDEQRDPTLGSAGEGGHATLDGPPDGDTPDGKSGA